MTRNTKATKRHQMHLEAMRECRAIGLTVAESAETIGISGHKATLLSWEITNPEGYNQWRRRTMEAAGERRKSNLEERACSTPVFWTLDRISKLKVMREAGISFGKCAQALGDGCTLNMVAGMCMRLGIKGPPRDPNAIREMVRDGWERGMTASEISSWYSIKPGTANMYLWALRHPTRAKAYRENATRKQLDRYYRNKAVNRATKNR